MSFSKVYSAQIVSLSAHIIDIEVDISNGMHSFSIVGLGDKAVDEARDRVSAAIKNSGFKSPKAKNQKVIVSLAPAEIKKVGSIYDAGMAIGYLLASNEITFNPHKKLFVGELSLDGEMRAVTGILPIIKHAKEMGFNEAYVPKANAKEASLIEGIKIFASTHLKQIIDHITEEKNNTGEEIKYKLNAEPQTEVKYLVDHYGHDFSDVKGQETAKRGLEIAAAGGHNLAMFGPPGTGKTMLAKAFMGILPPLSFEEILETTSIHSVAGILKNTLITNPPFRSPHHTSSYVSIVGGGTHPKPGEITLAHKGVLFLDEFPEFNRQVIDALREPLEEKTISISRAKGTIHFPAHFILIGAMNPCPCGNFGIESKECICSPATIQRYQQKISGPIVDRVDIWVEVSKVDYDQLGNSDKKILEKSCDIKNRVIAARNIQLERFKGTNIKLNSEMGSKEITLFSQIEHEALTILNRASKEFNISARSYHRIIKLGRTIADLAHSSTITTTHILEALQYRPKRFSL